MKRIVWLMLTTLLLGCGTDADDGKDSPPDTDVILGGSTTLNGKVSLGTPVEDATVQAWVLSLNDQWEEVGEATTNSGGIFKIIVPAEKNDLPLRLIAKGETAQYHEVSDGALATLGSDGRVMVDLEEAKCHEGALIHLNAWTTLAACLADGYSRGHQIQPAPTWTEATSLARLMIRDHLAGEEILDLALTGPSDLSRGPWPYPTPSTTLGLAAAGLSTLARTGFEPEATTAELVTWLCLDISDGLFNGKRRPPEEGEEDMPSLSLPDVIDADTTRYALAAATHAFLGSAVNESGVTPNALSGPGGYYEVVSMDEGPLYPGFHHPTLFDPFQQPIAFSADTPEEGAILTAAFTITVVETDPFGLVMVSFDGTTPIGPLQNDAAPQEAPRVLEVNPDLFIEQGLTTFQFTGTNEAGNETTLTRSFMLDSHPPNISVKTPDQQECHDIWPEFFTLEVTDAVTDIESVTRENGTPCSAGDGANWKCPSPTNAEDATTVTARDAAGNEAEAIVWLCRDNDPPAISFGAIEDLDWWGPAFPLDSFSVQITDPSGIAGWTVVDAEGKTVETVTTESTESHVSLTIPISGYGSYSLTVSAEDYLGNETSRTKSLQWDDDIPGFDAYVPSLPVLGSLQQMSFLISATDADSGVAKLEVISPGAWAVDEESMPEPDPGQKLFRVSGTPALAPPYDDIVDIEMVATDAAGNPSTRIVPVYLDLTAPIVIMSPTKAPDESECQPELDDNGELNYLCPQPTEELNEDTCEEVCPPIVKFASRLDYTTPEDAAAKQIPSLSFMVHDTCPVDSPTHCSMTYAWTFFREDKELTSGQIVVGYVGTTQIYFDGETQEVLVYSDSVLMDAENLFGAPAGEADFEDSNIPDRVIFFFSDAAGNTKTKEIALDLTILPPPVFLGWTIHSDPEIQEAWDAAPSILKTILESETHIMDQVAGLPKVEAARFVLTNPTAVPVLADFPVVPTHHLQIITRQGYLGNMVSLVECFLSSCAYATGPLGEIDFSDETCEVPEVFVTDILNIETPVTIEFADPDGTLEWSDNGVLLPPGAAVEGSLLVSLEPVPEVIPAQIQQVYSPLEEVFHEVPIHFLAGPDEWAACKLSDEEPGRIFRTTPALSRVLTHVIAFENVLLLATRNPGSSIAVTAPFSMSWYFNYLNSWPGNPAPPDL